MKVVRFSVLLLFICIVQILKSEEINITVSTPGSLNSLVEALEVSTITNLIIHGSLNGDDIATLRSGQGKLESLDTLNIKDVTLVPSDNPYYVSSYRGDGVWFTSYTRYFLSSERKYHHWAGGLSQASPQYHDYYDYNLAGAFQNTSLRRIVLPSSINEIGQEEFKNCGNLAEIEMQGNLVFVGADACNECTSLSQIPSLGTVKIMGRQAFKNCRKLTFDELDIHSLDSIPTNAFAGCSNIHEIEFSASLHYVDEEAFYESGLLKLKLSSSKTLFGSKAFANCKSLTNVEVSDKIYRIPYDLLQGTPWYNSSLRVSAGIRYVGNVATESVENHSNLYFVHEAIGIADNFNGNNLGTTSKYQPEYIDLSSRICYIGKCAFKDAAIRKIDMHNDLVEIADNAFQDCSNLIKADIPWSLKIIGKEAFMNCAIRELTIPKTVTSIGENAYHGNTSLTKLHWQADSITGTGIFSDCSALEELVFTSNVKHIPASAFTNCVLLKELVVPDSVRYVGRGAFSGCSGIANLYIGKRVSTDGTAFKNLAGLRVIDYQAESLDNAEYLFDNRPLLEQVTIGPEVKTIGHQFFAYSPRLKRVYYNARNLQESANVFLGCDSLEQIIIGAEVQSIPARCFSYSSRIQKLEFPSSLRSIGDGAFEGCSGVKIILFAEGLEKIGNFCFRFCDSIEEIVLPQSLIEVSAYSFSACNSLKKLSIGAQLTTTGTDAFRSDIEYLYYDAINIQNYKPSFKYLFQEISTLKNITFGPNVKVIPAQAFRGCTSLETIEIPDNVEEIGDWAFKGCSALTSVSIGKNMNKIQDSFSECTSLSHVTFNAINAQKASWAFAQIPSITKVVFGSDVKYIPSYCFYECALLETPEFPESLEVIGGEAFSGCTKITSFQPKGKLKRLEWGVFDGCVNLEEAIIPASIEYLSSAFVGCTGLRRVYAYYTPSPIELYVSAFSDETLEEGTLYVPHGTSQAYRATSGWNFRNIVEIDSSGINMVTQDDIRGLLYYDVMGRKLYEANKHGLTIVRSKNGSTYKTFIK